MWILEAVTLAAVLSSGLESGGMEASDDAGGLDRYVSYVHAQQVPEARIWLDRGVDPVLQPGDRVRIFYRTDTDAYVAILQIDTDGTTRMLYPRSPSENNYARADRDYRLLFPRSAYWNVDDQPGVGYFFVVTSPVPFDLTDFRYSYYDGGWDLSAVGSTVYSDPYVAMDDYVARLVPDWEYVDYGLDYVSYSVGSAHEYPRFLCYQCHGFRPYSTWDPYRYSCLEFRVIVYDDPYYYPSRRYRADRVVMAGPRNPTLPRFGFKERAAGEPGTPITVARQGVGEGPPPVVSRPGAAQRAGRAGKGRVASPPVVRSPTTTRRWDLSGRKATPGVRSDGVRVTPPRAVNPAPPRARNVAPPRAFDVQPRRPTLQRRSTPQSQSTRARSEAERPRAMPTPPRPSTRPSTRQPPQPRQSTPSRPRQSTRSQLRQSTPSQPRQSTRPPPAPSSRSSSARSRTPQPSSGPARPQRRPPGIEMR